jgi:hypothetical protein
MFVSFTDYEEELLPGELIVNRDTSGAKHNSGLLTINKMMNYTEAQEYFNKRKQTSVFEITKIQRKRIV